MYKEFAGLYDALMKDVPYEEWAKYYVALTRRHGVACRRAADCACGTGGLTLPLQAMAIEMTGLDISGEMLSIAAQKARQRGMRTPFILQDMRKLQLHRPMDAVFCACDGVNYLTQPGDVQSFFAASYQALRPGGGLFFDISSRYKLERVLGGNCIGRDGRDISYIWQNHYSPENRILQMDLSFFVLDRDNLYRRYDETHWQRAHDPDELVSWLCSAGFTNASAYGEGTFSSPGGEEERIYFAAVR